MFIPRWASPVGVAAAGDARAHDGGRPRRRGAAGVSGSVRPAGPGPRLLVPLALLALLGTACSQETREQLRQAAASVTVALPTAVPTRTGVSRPSGAPTGPTSQPTSEPTSQPTEEPTAQPTEGPTETSPTETTPVAPTEETTIPSTGAPTAKPTEGPGGGGQGHFLLALIEILRRLPPPGPSPSPTEAPQPSESPTQGPSLESPSPERTTEPSAEPTEGPTGGTVRATGPAGASGAPGATGRIADNEGQEIAAAAVSTASEDSTAWIWPIVLLVLGGVGWLVWRLTRRDRAHPPGPDT